ncbi:DUF5362 family protein [Mucilaginibacter sp.]|jgi:hypothetical protein|uniref:DUF5362 family protein n=1 Tax=Mucilaginibacter sp. TaxID=1882438 RepID=UPI003562CD04
METTENQLEPTAEPQIILSDEAQYYLQKAGQWAYFLGIVGFVLSGIFVLGSLFVGSIFSMMSKLQPEAATPYPAAMGGFLSFVYILLAVFYFFFSLYIYQFGSRIKNGILHSNSAEITTAFGKLKSFFKLWGITTIVIISLYALIFIAAIIGGAIGIMSSR